MKLYYSALALGAVTQTALWWYLVVLLRRTGCGKWAVSIGYDVIWITYLTGFLACAMAVTALFFKPSGKWLPALLLVGAIVGTAVFAALHLSGKVGQYIKH
jgi:hypothetical protein